RRSERTLELALGSLQIAGLQELPPAILIRGGGRLGQRRRDGRRNELRKLRRGHDGRRNGLLGRTGGEGRQEHQKGQLSHQQNIISRKASNLSFAPRHFRKRGTAPFSTRLTRRRGM